MVFYDGTTRLGGVSYEGKNNSKVDCFLDDGTTRSKIWGNAGGVFMLVVKYDWSDNSLSVYQDPDLMSPEPGTPTRTLTSGAWTQVDRIALDQEFRVSGTDGSTNFAIDEIKVTRHWELLPE